ncbi:MAG: glycosyltransferase family 4 protein [Bryobacteraceae bacterium]|nr:glycosyltransferase family 4 protein [Bryobacteraceae bacterium]
MRRGRKPQVLILNDYPVDRVEGGGAQRIRSLYEAMADRFELHLLCLTDGAHLKETSLAPGFRQTAVPKTGRHRKTQSLTVPLSAYSVEDVISLIWCAMNDELRHMFRRLADEADVLIFEHVYMAPLRVAASREIPVVYSAQNVEYLLKSQLLRGHPFEADLLEGIDAAEADLLESAAGVVAVSDEDAAYFRERTKNPVTVVGNGVDSAQFLAVDRRAKATVPEVVFIGSCHPPNVEAMGFILSQLAPRCPGVLFRVIGSVSHGLRSDEVPGNVEITGVISSERKSEMLRRATAAVNPMFSGSGSNLKLAEYFAASLPVVSTPFGARGYAVTDGIHLRIAGGEAFADALQSLLQSPEEQASLSASGRALAERDLCWTSLSKRYADLIERLTGGSN